MIFAIGVLVAEVQDGIAQLGRIQEGRRQTADLVRDHLDVLAVQTRQDGARLVADADHLDVRVGGELAANVTGNAGMHRTAQTTVRRDGNVQLLGVFLLRRDFGLLVELLRTDTVRSGLLQITLSTGILGGGHHLHGLGDLLDVLDRLQTDRNGLQRGHATVLLTKA